jgi:hypothetical protein
MNKRAIACCLTLVMSLVSAAALAAQTGDKTATQFYMEYRAAFDKAKTVDELLPFMSASRRKQIESTPAEERTKMFELMKILGALTNVKVTKETRSANGATLMVEALDPDKAKATGTVTLVQESGAWKVDKESFKSSSN